MNKQNIIDLKTIEQKKAGNQSPSSSSSLKSQSQPEIVYSWKAREYEQYTRTKKWYLIGGILMGAVIIGAFWTGNWMMGITFILVVIVGGLYLKKEPRMIEFKIMKKGIEADQVFYSFNNLKSFWIFYGLPQDSYVSIARKKTYFPYLQLPIGDADPVEIRKELLKLLPEKEHKEEITNAIGRLIKF
ncbi:MAG: hypothetical protein U9Q72_02515 [Patescibacteria group bacterium]|nr:hypothetical protein [Patescibacteria group bacterium]